MDINSLLSLRQAWHSFRQNHPKFPDFLRAVKAKGAVPGAEITITVSYPDGETQGGAQAQGVGRGAYQ